MDRFEFEFDWDDFIFIIADMSKEQRKKNNYECSSTQVQAYLT